MKPIDTSSPRTTLQGFLDFTSKGYEVGNGLMQGYLASSQLFFSPKELESLQALRHYIEAAERTLDLSELPQTMTRESARRFSIQLKEVLDRIGLPPIESIPDAQAIDASEFKRWTIPNTEIRIARVVSGERAGEYLFSHETVKRIPEFYAKVRRLPYKPGASGGWYDASSYSPIGVAIALHRIIPPRWVLNMPQWTRATLLDQPVWRWLGSVLLVGTGVAVIFQCFRLSRYWSERSGPGGVRWHGVLSPMSIVVITPVMTFILTEVLRISGDAYEFATRSLWCLFFLALTWAVWLSGGAIAESVIALERLRASSIDSQLIRLVLRLLTFIVAIVILVTGADRVGLPAYSVLAGLGVGGLAVALAAQQTLANLIGSLIIMFEKPFSIGHWIKVTDMEGIVEDVGFRSTRIRTFHGSLVTIPSSQLINSTINNMELREYRRTKLVLNLTYGTPVGKIERFVEDLREMLNARPNIFKSKTLVAFHDFGPYSLDILVEFFLKAPDRAVEIRERQKILLESLRLAEAAGIAFSFPTQTLHIERVHGEKECMDERTDDVISDSWRGEALSR